MGTRITTIRAPHETSEVLIAPADRVDIAVGPFDEGETLAVQSLKYNRGAFEIPESEPFATVRVGPAAPSRARIPARLRQIDPLVTGPVEPTRVIQLGFKLSLKHGVDFTINEELHQEGRGTRHQNRQNLVQAG